MAASCHRPAHADSTTRQYEVRGIVRGFAPDRSSIDIEHEDIPGFMPSMTMPFSVRDQKEIGDLRIGEAVSFRMIVTDKGLFLDRAQRIGAEDVHLAARAPIPRNTQESSPRLREGDAMPAFSLVDQDGKALTPETFRGRPFVVTFVFTRCPVPNFCPRMSQNFSEIEKAIRNDRTKFGNARLLSITLDPAFDTPRVLKEYAAHLGGDAKIWSFATGEEKEIDALTRAFSVYRQTEGGTISHGLATALIDKNGRIEKIWRGNGWTPNEVVLAIEQDLLSKGQMKESAEMAKWRTSSQ